MKKCPFCAEEIQDEAILCRFCGKDLGKPQGVKWYFKPSGIVMAFLFVGPFALPLVWFHPRFCTKTKVIVTVIFVVVSWYLTILVMQSMKSIKQYNDILFPKSF